MKTFLRFVILVFLALVLSAVPARAEKESGGGGNAIILDEGGDIASEKLLKIDDAQIEVMIQKLKTLTLEPYSYKKLAPPITGDSGMPGNPYSNGSGLGYPMQPYPGMGMMPPPGYMGGGLPSPDPKALENNEEGKRLSAELRKNPCAVPESIAASPRQLEAQAGCVECQTQPTAGMPSALSTQTQALNAIVAQSRVSPETERIERELRFFELNAPSEYGVYGSKEQEILELKRRISDYTSSIPRNEQRMEKKKETLAEQQKISDAFASLTSGTRSGQLRKLVHDWIEPRITENDRLNSALDGAKEESSFFYRTEKERLQKDRQELDYLKVWTAHGHRFGPLQARKIERTMFERKRHLDEARFQVEWEREELVRKREGIAAAEKRIAELQAPVEPASVTPDAGKLAQYEARVGLSITGALRCGLTAAEAYAIRLYTGSSYGWINGALRSQQPAEKARVFRDVLNSALAKLRPYEGTVRRGANLPPERLAQHQVGAVVTYPGYTSTSVGHGFGQRHRFVIRSKTGRFIDPSSANPGEYEVLFPPGTKFRVLERTENDNRVEFVMEEVE